MKHQTIRLFVKAAFITLAVLILLIGVVAGNMHVILPRTVGPDAAGYRSDPADVRGQIHVHGSRSFDSRGKLEEIARAAKASGVRWVILTDHPIEDGKRAATPRPIWIDGVLVIFGEERASPEGSRLTVASDEQNDPNPNWRRDGPRSEESRGALLVGGHLERFPENRDEVAWDALELVNLHANAIEKAPQLAWRIVFDPWRVYEALAYVSEENIAKWHRMSERLEEPLPIVAGPDAHANVRILGATADPYDIIFKIVSTHLVLEGGTELNEKTVLDAIRRGRTYMAFDGLGDTTGFAFFAEDSGRRRHPAGETLANARRIVVTGPSWHDTEIRVFRDNALVKQAFGVEELAVESPSPGFWRVEVRRKNRPWIISGLIRIIR